MNNVINKILNSIIHFTRSQCSCINVGVTCSNLGISQCTNKSSCSVLQPLYLLKMD